MEIKALYVVLFTVLIVALVAGVVFLNGNNNQATNSNANAIKGNSTGVTVNANLTQPAVVAQMNVTVTNSTSAPANPSSN